MDYRVKVGKYEDTQSDDDLLIFGYSCKLFRDDEKALSLEREEHLIPWMGDSNLMIDRFDVRGALYDLSEAESKGNSLEALTEAELKEEEICDQERYLALFHDEYQEQLAYEEEAKRLQVELASDGSNYNQVGFNYSVSSANDLGSNEYEDSQKQLVSEPVPDSPLVDEEIFTPLPEMNIPYGMEVPKTVKQNKIIIKTAKFVVSQGAQMEIIIKTKQAGNSMFNFLAFDNPLNAYYKHVVFLIRNGRYRWDDEADSQNSKKDSNDQYLHPNLSHSVRPDLTPGVASPSRPSPHCAYSNLITKIREKQKVSVVEDAEIHSPIAPSSPLQSSTPAAQEARSTPKATSCVGLVDYPSFNQTADGNSDEEPEPVFTKKFSKDIVHDYSKIKWPPPEIQMVIDKMASYIIKNGNGFEEVVRSRSDPRFEFLNKTHEYYPYYKCKIQLYSEVYGDLFKNTNKTQDWKKKNSGNGPKKNCDHSRNGGSRTISFSIKSREQEVSLTSHTTFPIESSTSEEDEDMEEEEKERRRVEREQRRQARKLREEKEKKEREEYLRKERLRKEKEEEERRKEKMIDDDDSGNEDLYDIFKYAQEMERDTSKRLRNDSPDEPNVKQEERKKKAVAFLSKLKDSKDSKDSKEEKKPIIYGPQMHPDMAAGIMRSAAGSPSSSRASSEGERTSDKPPVPPLPVETQATPPPPPKSPSPLGITEMLNKTYNPSKNKKNSEDTASNCPTSKYPTGDPTSMASVLLEDLSEIQSKQTSDRALEEENQNRKSRSHKKHSRQRNKEGSLSPNMRRDRKKRKRSHTSSHKRKKRRSRSRSRSRGRSKSHRSSKRKQSKRSCHRDRDKSRKKKHKRHKSPSSVSSLPSSESSSSSPSAPSTLPSESESDMDVQVIESDVEKSSRSSSIVSLPSTSSISKNSDTKKTSTDVGVESEEKRLTKYEGSGSGCEENSLSSTSALNSFNKQSRPAYNNLETSNSSESLVEPEKKPLFNPNTSLAMAKIAQGVRAKLNALLEKDSKLE